MKTGQERQDRERVDDLETLARQAKLGQKNALEDLLKMVQGRVFSLCRRMLDDVDDAEDAAQEIIIKIITHLSDFREESAFMTWAFRIASNHLMTFRYRVSRAVSTFDHLEDMTEKPAVDDGRAVSENPEQSLLYDELCQTCMQALLGRLDREARLAFILGDVFEVSGPEGAFILDITAAAFRQRLARGRTKLREFMARKCGRVRETDFCACRPTGRSRLAGTGFPPDDVDPPGRMPDRGKAKALVQVAELRQIQEKIAHLYRQCPEPVPPDSFARIVKDLIASGKYHVFADQ